MQAVGEAIVREARPTRELTALDYGCGTGLVSLFLLPHVRRAPGDFHTPEAAESVHHLGFDLEELILKADNCSNPISRSLFHVCPGLCRTSAASVVWNKVRVTVVREQPQIVGPRLDLLGIQSDRSNIRQIEFLIRMEFGE